jgi:hypothetical protein
MCRVVKPSDGLEPSTPSLPWNVAGNRWQPVATDLACFCRFRHRTICRRLPLVATTGLHKGSILLRPLEREDGPTLGAACASLPSAPISSTPTTWSHGDRDGGFTVRDRDGPKSGLEIHFLANLSSMHCSPARKRSGSAARATLRAPRTHGQWLQWEAIWRKPS